MTLMFNAVEFIHRLEKAGLAREAAETIASGIDDGRRDLVTKEELQRELATALYKQTIQIGALVGGMMALATAIIGVVVSAN